MKLKRLFKIRAKRLIERAESLTTQSFERILGHYNLDKNNQEEEKEIKMPKTSNDKKILNLKKSEPVPASTEFGIEIDLSRKDTGLTANLVAQGNEEKKDDANQEETKKSKEETSQLCGTKRLHTHSTKEDIGLNLKGKFLLIIF